MDTDAAIPGTVVAHDGQPDLPRGGEDAGVTMPPEPIEAQPPAVATSIILPAYNEAAALPAVLTGLFAVLAADRARSYEVLVVDDGSQDGSAAIAARYPCRVLRHAHNQGKGAAVRTGLQAARGQYVIIMDADNTYPPAAIPALVQQLATHDFVRAVRTAAPGTMPLVNRLGNLVFDRALWLLHGLAGHDQLTGLYGLRRAVLADLHVAADGFDLEVEIDVKAQAHHLRTSTLPITYQPRLGAKKLRPLHDGWRILKRATLLALLYNPVLTFLVPALLTLLVTGLTTAAFEALGYTADDSSHGIALLVVLSLAVGFQFFTAGTAIALFAQHEGEPARAWLLQIGSRRARAALAIASVGMTFAGTVILTLILIGHLPMLREFFHTQHVPTVAGVLILFGLQLLVTSMVLTVIGDDSISGPGSSDQQDEHGTS